MPLPIQPKAELPQNFIEICEEVLQVQEAALDGDPGRCRIFKIHLEGLIRIFRSCAAGKKPGKEDAEDFRYWKPEHFGKLLEILDKARQQIRNLQTREALA